MDKFNLKKYLIEGKLLKENREEEMDWIDPYDNPNFYDKKGKYKDEYYKEEFGLSFKEKQNWEKILNQVKKQYNFDAFDAKSLKNYDKIEDEANQIYIQKYGSSFLKEIKENMKTFVYDGVTYLITMDTSGRDDIILQYLPKTSKDLDRSNADKENQIDEIEYHIKNQTGFTFKYEEDNSRAGLVFSMGRGEFEEQILNKL